MTIVFAVLAVSILALAIWISYLKKNITTLNQRLSHKENIHFKESEQHRMSLLRAKKNAERNEAFIARYDKMLGESIPLRLDGPKRSGKKSRLVAYYIDQLFLSLNHEIAIDKLPACSSCSEQHMRNEVINLLKKQVSFAYGLKIKVLEGGKKVKMHGVNDKFMKAQNKAKALGIDKKINEFLKQKADEEIENNSRNVSSSS
jgi:hypothetical protein